MFEREKKIKYCNNQQVLVKLMNEENLFRK